MKTIENDAVLLCDSHHGVYMPQIVMQNEINNEHWDFSGVSQQNIDLLLKENSQEDEWYWEAWQDVENNTIIIDEDGTRYYIVCNEDYWLVPEECMEQVEEWLI